ncbi:MAG: flagellar basal-body rod protein FlgF [Clostridiales bacterium]|nr:flagellar basal-body rod protein FlgF [Clostridiales bacterium]
MVKGLYASAVGMTAQMKRMDVIADNLANVNTTGFKKDRAVTHSFSEELLLRLNDEKDKPFYAAPIGRISQGVFIDDIYTSHENGSFKKTGGPLDLAIEGSGFFCVFAKESDGQTREMYTRDGSFTLTENGALATKDGFPVMGSGGPVILPPGEITIEDDGRIYSNLEYVDTLKIASFTDLRQLRKTGGSLFYATAAAGQDAFSGKIQQGFLENSNVSSIREMTDMISVSRAYDANQKMILSHDNIMMRTANDIARK